MAATTAAKAALTATAASTRATQLLQGFVLTRNCREQASVLRQLRDLDSDRWRVGRTLLAPGNGWPLGGCRDPELCRTATPVRLRPTLKAAGVFERPQGPVDLADLLVAAEKVADLGPADAVGSISGQAPDVIGSGVAETLPPKDPRAACGGVCQAARPQGPFAFAHQHRSGDTASRSEAAGPAATTSGSVLPRPLSVTAYDGCGHSLRRLALRSEPVALAHVEGRAAVRRR